jgi:hypothetical protein
LAATDDGGQGAAGTFLGQVVFRNISEQTCTLFGYPGLQRLDASRAPLPTEVIRLPEKPSSLVTLAPQEQASFGYSYCSGCGTSTDDQGTCTPVPSAFVEVTPPDERDFIVVPSTIASCDVNGRIKVSALAPGKTGKAI